MRRSAHNPIVTREDIISTNPRLKDPSSVFNPGGISFEGKILLLLRCQNRARETYLLRAMSEDGFSFEISPEPIDFRGLEQIPYRIFHIYDPRLTQIEGRNYVSTAIDTDRGCFSAIFETTDFRILQLLSFDADKEARNLVLFPALINGSFCRFERPNRYSGADRVKTGQTITCSLSPDLIHWDEDREVFSGRAHYWDELIGSGPPPIRSKAGWLHIYHGVATHFGASNIYQMGISLQDLKQPWITLARGRYNILEPRELYELTGQVPNVVFPTAAIPLNVDSDGFTDPDSPVLIYYGAADTSVCLAETTIKELMEDLYA